MKRTHYTPGGRTDHGAFCCCPHHRPQLHRKEITMEKLSDEDLNSLEATAGWLQNKRRGVSMTHDDEVRHGERIESAIAELRDLRAARAASRERVMAVVRDALWDATQHMDPATRDSRMDAIATRVADVLAAPQPRRVPTLDETLDRHAGVMAGLAVIERQERVLDARVIAAQMAHHVPGLDADALVLDIANQKWHHVAAEIARVARGEALDSSRIAKAIVDAADEPRDRYDADPHYDIGELIDDVASAAAQQLAGQAVALSAEELRLVQAIRADLIGDVAITEWSRHVALLDRLLSAPGQAASPAAPSANNPGILDSSQPGPHRYDRDPTSGIGQCLVCGSDNASDGNHVVAEPEPATTVPSALDAHTCRRLASEAAEDDARMRVPGTEWYGTDEGRVYRKLNDVSLTVCAVWRGNSNEAGIAVGIARTRNNLPAIARQLTAAAELAERHAAFVNAAHYWKDAAERMQQQRDAAQAECERLRADVASLVADRDHYAATGDQARRERNLAQAECEWMRAHVADAGMMAERITEARRHVDIARAQADERGRECAKLMEDVQAARAECDRLRAHGPGFYGRAAARMVNSIRALLATEPAVSEQWIGEAERLDARGMPITIQLGQRGVADSVLAAARQMHELRAGLQQIVGGEPAPRTWAVIPERVDAIRYAIELIDQVVAGQARNERIALAAMLAEIDGATLQPDLRTAIRTLIATDKPAEELRRALAELIA